MTSEDSRMSGAEVEMDPATYDRIVAFYEEGEKFVQEGRIGSALGKYADAWALIPDPKERWTLSTSVISAIADCWFLAGEYAEVLRALEFGMNCPGAVGNPFLHLRLGQALLEQGEEDRGEEELMRAYDAHGAKIFEHQDPKYLDFLAARGRTKG
jgi:tetratricopeptide (TPR) repeat protein